MLKAIFITSFLLNFANASGTQTFSKELVGGTERDVGELVTYELKSACNSLNGDVTIINHGMFIELTKGYKNDI